jgi:hypothetical protein
VSRESERGEVTQGPKAAGPEGSEVTQKVITGYPPHVYSDPGPDVDDIGTAIGWQRRIDTSDRHAAESELAEVSETQAEARDSTAPAQDSSKIAQD